MGSEKAEVLLHVLSSFRFSCSAVSDSLQSHGLQHTRPPCPSPAPGVYSNSCPSSWWCGSFYPEHCSKPREKQGNGKTTRRLFKLLPGYGIDHFHSWFMGQSTSYIQTWFQWGKNILPTGKASERCPLGNDIRKMGSKKIGKNKQQNLQYPLSFRMVKNLKLYLLDYFFLSQFEICLRAKIRSYTHHIVDAGINGVQ